VGLALVIRIFGGMDTRRGVLAYDAMPSPMFLGIAAALSAVGGALILLRAALGQRLDPNANYPQRPPARRGEPRAVRTPEYQQQLDAEHGTAADAWYYSTPAGELGPVSRDELAAMLASGSIEPATWVWTDGMPEWLPADVAMQQ
jgi:hypothetical protein